MSKENKEFDMNDFNKAVYEFNAKRNNFRYNKELEEAMFAEEVLEFKSATKLSEMIDAFVDTEYVSHGATLKEFYAGKPSHLEDRAELVASMANILIPLVGSDKISDIINKAREIVCRINAMKLTALDENGKVAKHKELPNATLEISQMLKDNGIEDTEYRSNEL